MAIEFLKPVDGDVLFSVADGVETPEGLTVKVSVKAEPGRFLRIGGAIAEETDGVYTADVLLDAYRNPIEASDPDSGESETIVVYWFKNAYKTYRMAVDDVIRCFENIYKHQDEYQSIFDDPFLRIFKDLHDAYGTPTHMHVYYENDDGSFNLTMFPEKYKAEFQANGDWLKFTFHSKKDKPNSPYKFASYKQVMKEGRQVEQELRRFAGPEVFSSITSQHFADSNLYATRAFRNLGFRVLDAEFAFKKNGEPYVSYYLDGKRLQHAAKRDFWVDNKEDIIFVHDDLVLNKIPADEVDAAMEALSAREDHCFHYLLIHEQYFYEDFKHYEPDYRERIFNAVAWCHAHGYRPVTLTEIAVEPRPNEIP